MAGKKKPPIKTLKGKVDKTGPLAAFLAKKSPKFTPFQKGTKPY